MAWGIRVKWTKGGFVFRPVSLIVGIIIMYICFFMDQWGALSLLPQVILGLIGGRFFFRGFWESNEKKFVDHVNDRGSWFKDNKSKHYVILPVMVIGIMLSSVLVVPGSQASLDYFELTSTTDFDNGTKVDTCTFSDSVLYNDGTIGLKKDAFKEYNFTELPPGDYETDVIGDQLNDSYYFSSPSSFGLNSNTLGYLIMYFNESDVIENITFYFYMGIGSTMWFYTLDENVPYLNISRIQFTASFILGHFAIVNNSVPETQVSDINEGQWYKIDLHYDANGTVSFYLDDIYMMCLGVDYPGSVKSLLIENADSSVLIDDVSLGTFQSENYTSAGYWQSQDINATSPMDASYYSVLEYSNASVDSYITAVQWVQNGSVVAEYSHNLTSGTNVFVDEGSLTGGSFVGLSGLYQIKVFFVSDGNSTCYLDSVSGFGVPVVTAVHSDVPVIPHIPSGGTAQSSPWYSEYFSLLINNWALSLSGFILALAVIVLISKR